MLFLVPLTWQLRRYENGLNSSQRKHSKCEHLIE